MRVISRHRIYWVSQILSGLVFRTLSLVSYITFGFLFFRLAVVGRERVRKLRGPLIITPNHKSYVDSFFILAALPLASKLLPVRAMAIDWLFRVPLVGWALTNLFGAYPVKRGQGPNISLRKPLQNLQDGYVVANYPEGGIRFRPGVHKVTIGAAALAQETGAPILPVAIRGVEYLSWRAFFFGRRNITVIFGAPFFVDAAMDRKQAAETIKAEIEKLYHQ